MPKRTGAAGARREVAVRDLYRKAGWLAFKTSDSSIADVIACRAIQSTGGLWAHLLFIEVKANKAGGPFSNFRAPERAALKAVAARAGAQAVLIWWPPGGKRRTIHSSEWPSVREPEARAA